MAKKKSAAPTTPETAPAVTASPAADKADIPANVQIKAPPKLEARNALIDKLAAGNESVMRAEMVASDQPSEEIPAEPLIDEPLPIDELEPVDDDNDPELDAAPVRTVKIKVDGQEREVPEEAIRQAGIRALQKESAADARLNEAALARKQAEEILENAKRITSQHNTELDEPSDELPDADVDTLAHAIQFGTEAEVKQAVKTLLKQSSPGRQEAIPKPEYIVEQVKAQLEFDNAVKQFQTDYSDIWSDDRLKSLAFEEDLKIQKAIAAGERPPIPYSARFAEAGKAVRTWRDQFVKSSGAPRVDIDASKVTRKAAAGNIPTAGGRSNAGLQPAPLQDSTSIVADMRRARGQIV
jgi:hypothetical protein